jgi:hypothetical protein
VLRRVQRDLDLETMLLEAAENDAPESPYGLQRRAFSSAIHS